MPPYLPILSKRALRCSMTASSCAVARARRCCAIPRTGRKRCIWLKSPRLDSSPADYRQGIEGKEVASLFHGAYRRCVVEEVGPLNEGLLRTEDNDWYYRMRQAGYRLWFDPSIRSQQFARPTLRRMLKQKYGNGFWVGRTLFVQPKCLQLHHLVPLAFVLGIAAMGVVGFAFSWVPFGVCAVLYLLLCVALAVKAVVQSDERNWTAAALPLVFMGIHLSYGIGTLFGLVSGLARKLLGGNADASGGKGGGAGSGAAAWTGDCEEEPRRIWRGPWCKASRLLRRRCWNRAICASCSWWSSRSDEGLRRLLRAGAPALLHDRRHASGGRAPRRLHPLGRRRGFCACPAPTTSAS